MKPLWPACCQKNCRLTQAQARLAMEALPGLPRQEAFRPGKYSKTPLFSAGAPQFDRFWNRCRAGSKNTACFSRSGTITLVQPSQFRRNSEIIVATQQLRNKPATVARHPRRQKKAQSLRDCAEGSTKGGGFGGICSASAEHEFIMRAPCARRNPFPVIFAAMRHTFYTSPVK